MEIDMNKIDSGNSLTITIPKEVEQSFGTSCLVCGECVPLNGPLDPRYKICDKCKRAILKMREYMKEDNK